MTPCLTHLRCSLPGFKPRIHTDLAVAPFLTNLCIFLLQEIRVHTSPTLTRWFKNKKAKKKNNNKKPPNFHKDFFSFYFNFLMGDGNSKTNTDIQGFGNDSTSCLPSFKRSLFFELFYTHLHNSLCP